MKSTDVQRLVDLSGHDCREQAAHVTRRDTHEPMVWQTDLEAAGIVCQPFWDTPCDLEGECYTEYIASHKDFSLGVRQSLMPMITAAQSYLPLDWQIVLKAGYRPIGVQRRLMKKFTAHVQRTHTDWSNEQCIMYARDFVADPTSTCPPHTTGGAIDIDIVSRTNQKPVDMGCPPNADTEIARLWFDGLTDEQRANRTTLVTAMIRSGFAPLPAEWWHFQYGDTYWAAFYGHDTTLYDIMEEI